MRVGSCTDIVWKARLVRQPPLFDPGVAALSRRRVRWWCQRSIKVLTCLSGTHVLCIPSSRCCSLLVRAVSGGVSVLLIGDAENDEQEALLRDVGPAGLHVQVLKVAHHGSVYQDLDLLDAVDPAVALVSVGAVNPYGHPSLALLDRLARDGARVFRTDLDGDVAVVVRDGSIGVVQNGSDRRGQAFLHLDTELLGSGRVAWWNVRVCRYDPLGCSAARHRRRRVAGRVCLSRGRLDTRVFAAVACGPPWYVWLVQFGRSVARRIAALDRSG